MIVNAENNYSLNVSVSFLLTIKENIGHRTEHVYCRHSIGRNEHQALIRAIVFGGAMFPINQQSDGNNYNRLKRISVLWQITIYTE